MSFKIFLGISCILPCVLHAQQTEDSAEKNWSGSVAGYYYFIPGQNIHPTIIGCADNRSLHFETRYNYEDINTASAFAGYTWAKDGNFSITVTPMVGVAVGNSSGILPGLECTASYSNINFYSENEYMLAFSGRENYFFYSWSQLSASTFKNMQAGMVAQTLRWYQTKFDIQRGPYVEYSWGNFTFDAYYFNPLTQYDFVVASLTYEF